MDLKNFLFLENFYVACCLIEDPHVRLALYDLLCTYGVTGENRIESYPMSEEQREIVTLILTHIFISILNMKQRYVKAVENGRKGGLKGGHLGGRGHKKTGSASQTAPIDRGESKCEI